MQIIGVNFMGSGVLSNDRQSDEAELLRGYFFLWVGQLGSGFINNSQNFN